MSMRNTLGGMAALALTAVTTCSNPPAVSAAPVDGDGDPKALVMARKCLNFLAVEVVARVQYHGSRGIYAMFHTSGDPERVTYTCTVDPEGRIHVVARQYIDDVEQFKRYITSVEGY